MSIEERLKAAVEPIVPVCVHGVYTGTEPVYCTFNFTEMPDSFGDNAPEAIRCSGMLHLYMPVTSDPRGLKRDLRRTLLAAELGAATVEDASDKDNIHLVFEFEALDLEV
ncbi:MAG: hypothetical protein IJ396_07755 [Oscillibacter sp.]|nr:hypothetical protein [Oscillibacter sp.]MBQ7778791.1 hypothetical protein [Oscillibacter sp.]